MQEESIFCKYCKAKLTVELEKEEIEKGYHNSCHEIMMKEKALSIMQVINSFSILTNGQFKILNITREHDYGGEFDYDFVSNLEKNTLYLKQKPTITFEFLYLSNIDKIPFELTFFTDLKVLKITNNYSIILNDYLGLLQNIQALDIEYRDGITGLEFISELKHLTYLRLAGPLPKNFIFSDSFRHLKNMKYLELESFDSPNLIEILENYSQLKKLSLNIGIIKEPFVKLESLEEVKFSNVKFSAGFIHLFESQNLKRIIFLNCPIESMPDSFSENSILENLLIINCSITQLPPSLSLVKKLNYLELKSTNITSFPYELKKLQSIRIEKSYITEINSTIEQCSNLKGITIISSPIKKIDKKISSLKNLKALTLSGTEITRLPDSMGTLDSLEVLDLSNNKIKAVPGVISKLGNLKTLILDKNVELSELPDELLNLSNLERLSVKLIPLSSELKKKLTKLAENNPTLNIVYY